MCRGVFLRVIGVCAVLAACATDTSDTKSEVGEIYFIREHKNDARDMAALWEGTLTLTEGCLRVQSDTNEGYTPIWPFEYGFGVEGDSVSILGAEGQVLARVGDYIRVGGGEGPLSAEALEEVVVTGPVRCAGPYWYVGSVEEARTP